jgi:flavorubredoxin
MDHSGSLSRFLSLAPDAKVVTSPNGEKGLRRHFEEDWDFSVVESGDTLDIGKRTLQFFLIPMVHWPDNMVTYIPEEKILLSNDAFGQHIATPERFDDEIGLDIIHEEAAKYYANIVLPYVEQVKNALDVLRSKAILIGSPTLNNGMFPPVGAFLTYLKGLRPKDRIGFAFGSYGWGGQAVKEMETIMSNLGWVIPFNGIKIQYIPDEKELKKVREVGKKLGEVIKNG